jgi:hypothetical protein
MYHQYKMKFQFYQYHVTCRTFMLYWQILDDFYGEKKFQNREDKEQRVKDLSRADI